MTHSRTRRLVMLAASTALAVGGALLPTSAFAAPATQHTGTTTVITGCRHGNHGHGHGKAGCKPPHIPTPCDPGPCFPTPRPKPKPDPTGPACNYSGILPPRDESA